ncbi:MAG: hypothetical protein WCJ40_01565 [Planctomycetota bacterium]
MIRMIQNQRIRMNCMLIGLLQIVAIAVFSAASAKAFTLKAGIARVDVTDRVAKPANDPLYVKALVLKQSTTTLVLITVDAVAIGGIGPVGNDYLEKVRNQVWTDLQIPATSLVINASHCHGIVRTDIADLTIKAVKEAYSSLVEVRSGAGTGLENRIMENRRLTLRDGSESDVRHAYSVVAEEQVANIGPVDPEIGLMKLERMDGKTLAVLYNFACHPIHGVPNKGNTADFPGFASQVIEENTTDGALAFFVQGCGGDINPIRYKDVNNPRDAETLGNLLGLSVLKGIKKIQTQDQSPLKVVHETLRLPRAADYEKRMDAMKAKQLQLLQSLQGTSLNFKNFMPLFMKYKMSPEFPLYDSHLYKREDSSRRDGLKTLDIENRANLEAYEKNIKTMEELTRLQTNLDLLKMHQAQTKAAGTKELLVEVVGIRVGEFVMVTFPGELTVQIGLNIKKLSPHELTFVAGYTNGYIYYTPTSQQRKNTGYAQEDCDSLVAPEWQKLFEDKVLDILKKL